MDNNPNNEQPQVDNVPDSTVSESSYFQPEAPITSIMPEVSPAPIMPVSQPQPIIAPVLPKKKSHKLLIIILILIIVVAAGVGGGYLYLKNNADKAASTYKVSLKTYMADVHQNLETAKTDPLAAQEALSKLEKPTLDNVTLSTLSPDYVNAVTVSNEADVQVDKVNNKVGDYIVMYNLAVATKAFFDSAAKAPKLDQDMINTEYASGVSLENSTMISALRYYADAFKTFKQAIDEALIKVSDDGKQFMQQGSDMLGAYIIAMDELIDGYITHDDAKISLANEHALAATAKYGSSSDVGSSQTQEEMSAYSAKKSAELDDIINNFDSYYTEL